MRAYLSKLVASATALLSVLPVATNAETIEPPQFRTGLWHFERTIDVSTRRLSTALSEQKAAFPDVLIVDVQGAEYRVLSSLGDQVLAGLRLIFAEVSTEAVYQGARPLGEVQEISTPFNVPGDDPGYR